MKNRSFNIKSVLPFWQEFVLAIGLGILLTGMTINISAAFQQTLNIVAYCIFLSLFICLIGQFFWKNFFVGITLSVILGLGSIYMILVILLELYKELYNISEGDFQATIWLIFGLFVFLGLTIAAISMPLKYK